MQNKCIHVKAYRAAADVWHVIYQWRRKMKFPKSDSPLTPLTPLTPPSAPRDRRSSSGWVSNEAFYCSVVDWLKAFQGALRTAVISAVITNARTALEHQSAGIHDFSLCRSDEAGLFKWHILVKHDSEVFTVILEANMIPEYIYSEV